MKIIILGAGEVGAALAVHLVQENKDITIIDKSAAAIHKLGETLDIKMFIGNASHPHMLLRAGADEADLLVAVTDSDETNMIACQIAHTLFQIPKKIARVRSLQYSTHENLFGINAIPIDVIISPEQLVTTHIRSLIEYPNALQVFDFANKKVQLIIIKALTNNPLIGHTIGTLELYLRGIDVSIVAIFREDFSIIPTTDSYIQENDEVFFLVEASHAHTLMDTIYPNASKPKNIMIAGGGNIGARLALTLENEMDVKIIDRNKKNVEFLATNLKKGIVLHGDVTDRDLLSSENIENTDIFCAVTNHDEINIMASLLAKDMGAKKVLTLINKISYIEIVKNINIDSIISPQQTTMGSLLTHIRQGDVVKVHSLRRGAAEAIEAIVHGDINTSLIVGKRVSEIALPHGAIIGAIIRQEEIIINNNVIVIQPGDHIIMFLSDKNQIPDVEKLFQLEAKS